MMPYKSIKKRRETQRVWREKNAEKTRERMARWNHANKEYVRAKNIERKYGLRRQKLDEMLENQHHSCAVCREPFAAIAAHPKHKIHVDHCHETKRVRALLCGNCNVALGLSKEDPERLRKLADYIEWQHVVSDLLGARP